MILTAIDSLLHVDKIGWTQLLKSPSEGSVIPVCDNNSSCSSLVAFNCSNLSVKAGCLCVRGAVVSVGALVRSGGLVWLSVDVNHESSRIPRDCLPEIMSSSFATFHL